MDSKNSYISTVRDALSEDSNDEANTSSNMTQFFAPASSSSSPMQESPVPNAAKKVKPSYNVFSFSNIHGRNITLSNSNTVATRTVRFCKSLVFANQRLKRGYSFKFCVEKMCKKINSTIAVGAIASLNNLTLPGTAFGLKRHCWIITNHSKNNSGKIVLTRDAEFLKNIKEKSIVSLYFHYDGTLFLVLDNKYWCEIAKLAKKYRGIYPTVDLYGKVSEISIVPPEEILPERFKLETIVECSEEVKEDNKSAMDSKNSYISTVRDALSEDSNDEANTSLNMTQFFAPASSSSSPMQESPVPNAAKKVKPSYNVFSFSNIHGRNITLSNSNTVATRTVRFCKSLVFANQRLKRGYSFKFCVEKMCKKINSTIAVGAIASLNNLTLPGTAFGLKRHCWIITNHSKNNSGKIVLTREAEFLKNIKEKSIVSLYFHYDGTLFLVLDNKYWCEIAKLAKKYRGIYPTVDLYGKVSEISIVPPEEILPERFKLETIVECSEEVKEDFEENID